MKKRMKLTKFVVLNLTVTILVSISSTGCFSKDDTAKRNPSDTGAQQEVQARQQTDRTLLGYDISLTPAEFQTKYAEKIKKCGAMVYTFGTSSSSAETLRCDLADGLVEFYAGEVYRLEVSIPQTDIKILLAAQKLTEKAGGKADVKSYRLDRRFGYMAVCTVWVPFHKGDAVLMSIGSLPNEILASATEADTSACADMFAKSIKYENANSINLMKQEISTKQGAKDQQAGEKFSL